MKDKLRDLAERWSAKDPVCEAGVITITMNQCADELLAILDAEGDGVAVAWMSPNKERLEFSRPDTVYGSHTIPLYTHPARSGVVSDEDVEAACIASLIQYDDGTTEWDGYTDKEKGYAMNRMRRALEHFAKGERHER